MTLTKLVDGIRQIGVKRSFRRRGVSIYHLSSDKGAKLHQFITNSKFTEAPTGSGNIKGDGQLYVCGKIEVLIHDSSQDIILSVWGLDG